MMAALKVIVGLLLLIAIAKMPYGYYITLRWIVSITAVISSFKAFKSEDEGWGWTLIAIVLLFNPFFPLHLNKGLWAVIDIGAAIVFFASISVLDE